MPHPDSPGPPASPHAASASIRAQIGALRPSRAIRLYQDTYAELDALRRGRETFDAIVRRLLDTHPKGLEQ